MEDNKVIKFKKFHTVEEAEILRALLESAGVMAIVEHAQAGTMLPIGGAMEVDVIINAEDLERAREVVTAKFDQSELEDCCPQ